MKEINYSPLCQNIISEGKTAKVIIYEHENGGWILEIEDEQRSSYIWNYTFSSDQEALSDAISVLENEGIEALLLSK